MRLIGKSQSGSRKGAKPRRKSKKLLQKKLCFAVLLFLASSRLCVRTAFCFSLTLEELDPFPLGNAEDVLVAAPGQVDHQRLVALHLRRQFRAVRQRVR